MIDAVVVAGFAGAAIRVGTPLGLAALGEVVAEKSGVVNLGIEGAMLAGAFGAAAGAAQGGVWVGVLSGTAAGAIVAALFAGIAIGARVDQIISGTAITLGMTGLTGLLAQRLWGNLGVGLSLPTLRPAGVPLLESLPLVGTMLFRQPVPTYAAYLLVPVLTWILFRTRFGLELRACGESPAAAAAAGVRVARTRTIATLVGGLCAGLAGASLVLAQVGTFTERMTAGRGFIAIAIVALGRWHPWGVAAAALLFGAATAVQYVVQAAGSQIPYQVLVALPYLLALAVLAVATGRRRGPAALGQPH